MCATRSGAAVPAASVEVRNLETGEVRRAATDERGGYTVPNLMPGRYDTEVDAAGFRHSKQTGLELQVDQTARLDFTLEVGAVTESVEVTAQIPQINTENAVKGDVIVNQEIVSMPLEGRDFFELGLLVPGVAEKREGSWQGSAMAVNGARPDNTNFVVDGFNNQNQRGGQAQVRPPIEAMQEFKVETSGYRCRVRPAGRRRGQHGAEDRHQPVPRHAVRVPAQRQIRCPQLLRGGHLPSCGATSSAPR